MRPLGTYSAGVVLTGDTKWRPRGHHQVNADTAAQVEAVMAAAERAGVYSTPVFRSDGRANEVSVWQGGENIGSIYRPAGGGLAVWIYTGQQRRVSDAVVGARDPREDELGPRAEHAMLP